jgi:hypothetical protein
VHMITLSSHTNDTATTKRAPPAVHTD